MTSINHTYISESELLLWLKSTGFHDTKESILVQIFDATLNKEQLLQITKIIKSFLPQSIIVGSSSSGVIRDGEMVEYITNINICSFNFTSLQAFSSLGGEACADGKNMAEALIKKDTKCVLLFLNNLHYDSQAFVKSFNDNGGDKVILAGGGAGDNFLFDDPFTIFDTQIDTKQVVGVALSGKELHCVSECNDAWQGIGRLMQVTKAEKNCIYEIDNMPILEIYRKYLGENITKSMPASLLEFPLIFTVEGVELVAIVDGICEDGGFVYSSNIVEGTEVRFGIGDENRIVSNMADIYIKMSLEPIEALFTYTDASRKIFFDKHLDDEYTALSTLAPLVGFVSYGEYTRVKNKNRATNATTIFLGLSESKKINTNFQTSLLHPSYRKKSSSAIANLMDVTTKELNQQIEENDNVIHLLKQYKYALDSATLVSKTDVRGIITYVNENFCQLSGYTQKELIGKPHNIVRSQEMSSDIFKEMWGQIQNKTIWRGMVQNKHKNGSSYYVYATIFPILGEHNEIVEYMSVREDLTARIQHEKRLEREKEHLYQILDNQSSIVVVTTKKGYVTYLNKKFFDYFDFENLESFLSQYNCICDLYVDKFGKNIGCGTECHIHISYDNESAKEQVYILDKNERVITFNISTKKTAIDDGEDMYLSTLTDITEVEQARAHAEEAMNVKARFLANMSHEIRTPMNGIIGFTDLLSGSDLNEKQRGYVEIIKNSAEMLLDVVNGILDFSKIESEAVELDFVETNLFIETHNIYQNYFIAAEKKNIVYKMVVDTKIDENLSVDRVHLNQTLSNLINNAIKFTDEKGSILIKLSVLKDSVNYQTVRFLVKDNGFGISKRRQDKIFEAFLQEDNSTTREFGGTGLGLSISSSLVELMGGHIELVSEKKLGSEFSFVLKFNKVKNSQLQLSKLIDESCVQVIDKPKESDKVVEYLHDFGIKTCTLSSLEKYHKNYRIIILFDVEEALSLYNILDNEDYFIVCLAKDISSASKVQNFKIMSNYNKCTTELYNVLYAHSVLKDTFSVNKHSFKGLKVLVADDNEVNQMLIEEVLKNFGIEPVIVKNGKEALSLAQKEKYDAIFMDINMPIMNGKESTKKILADSLNIQTSIIAMTSNVLEDDILEYKKIGMKEHLGKPFHSYDIFTILSKISQINTIDIQKESQSNTKVINSSIKKSLDKAGKQLGLPKNIMHKLFEKFLLTMEDAIREMHLYEQQNEYEKILLQTHKLKGASSSMCLDTVTEIVQKIEIKIKADNTDNVNKDIKNLKKEFKQLLKYKSEL